MNWREKIRQFTGAEAFEENSRRVDQENIRMLYLLNGFTVFFSAVLFIYSFLRGGYIYVRICGAFFLGFLATLLLVHFGAPKNRLLLNTLIILDYILLTVYFFAFNICQNRNSSITAYYILLAPAFCFLLKPLWLALLQSVMILTVMCGSYFLKPATYAEVDIINGIVVLLVSVLLGSLLDANRVRTLRQLDDHDRLRQRYKEELVYSEKALSGDVMATGRINLSTWMIEEMRMDPAFAPDRSCQNMDVNQWVSGFTSKLCMSEEQFARLSRKNLIRLLQKGKNKVSEEFALELPDGTHMWLRADVNLLKRPDTSEALAFLYCRNLTQEKRLEQILERMMALGYDEIYTVDGYDGQVEAVAVGLYAMENQMRQGTYEQELAILVSRTVRPEDADRIRRELALEKLREQLKQESVFMVEISLMSRNGKPRLKQICCMYLDEQLGTLLVTLTDIENVVREEKEKQEQLEQALRVAKEANAAKTSFLAGMSHEIRTPMNAIIGLNSIIREDVDNRAQVMDCTEKLDSVSHYLLALLNDILDMSRIESGNMQLAHQPFEGDKFWDNVNMLAKAQAILAGVEYRFHRQTPVSAIYIGDSTRLGQIMINLINNAIKFTRRDGYVDVKVEEGENSDGRGEIRVQVEDNGIGISKEFLPNVFGTFTQEHSGTTSNYGGSGLGLSIARNFARMMDGDITVESTVGEGTTFTVHVLLDLDKERTALGERREKREKWDFTGKRVLLVEDHPLNVMVATRLLLKKGFEVDSAKDGREALNLFSQSEVGYYDVILMDIRMPVMDGIECTKRIRGLTRIDATKVPIIAMTANAYDEDRRQTKAVGMDAHLAKPIDPKLLYETLLEFLNV